MRLEYVGTDITELSLRKDIPDDAEIELQTNTNYTVYFSEDGDSCYGEFNVEIISQHDPSMLSINYCSKSYFNIYPYSYHVFLYLYTGTFRNTGNNIQREF